MHFRTIAVFTTLATSFALVVGCDRTGSSSSSTPAVAVAVSPVGPSTTPSASVQGTVSASPIKGQLERLVTIQDACDPTTFNETLGPGTCVRSGGLQFDKFIEELTRHRSVGAWHFAPPDTTARVGQTFVAINRGGEEHTFTEVAQFGGGIVPLLNNLAGVPVEAPECAALEADDFVKPGETYREDLDHAGTVKFQCCIHPWMRLEARVTEK